MLFDEAIYALTERLETAPVATLRITVEHGEYQASYATGVTPCVGRWLPNLTDALVSLVEELGA